MNSLKLRNTELLMSNDETHIGTQPSLKHTWRCTVWFFFQNTNKKSCKKYINWFISQSCLFENPVVSLQHLACIKNIKFNTRKDHA